LPIQLDVQKQKGKERGEEYGFQLFVKPTTNIVALGDVPPNKEGDATITNLEHTSEGSNPKMQML
jgi:hypothetical protein